MRDADNTRNEYGRFQLHLHPEDTTTLLLENVNRKDEYWLTLSTREKPHSPIGYLRLCAVSPGSLVFEVTEVRPAIGRLLRLPDDSPGIEEPSPGGSA